MQSSDKSSRLKQIADELKAVSVALHSTNYQRGSQISSIAFELNRMAAESHERAPSVESHNASMRADTWDRKCAVALGKAAPSTARPTINAAPQEPSGKSPGTGGNAGYEQKDPRGSPVRDVPVGAAPSSIAARNDRHGDLWTDEVIAACKRAGWYLPDRSKGLTGYYPSERMLAFKAGYEEGKAALSAIEPRTQLEAIRADVMASLTYLNGVRGGQEQKRTSEQRARDAVKKLDALIGARADGGSAK